jgi:ketosteroid isomerase-like protein
MLRPILLAAALLGSGQLRAQLANADSATAEHAVRAFHAALSAGDVAAIQRLLSPSAVILEGGERESREEYLAHHVKADIEFAKSVPTRTRKLESRISGEVAWVNSTSVSVGRFRNRSVNLVGAELIVLTRSGSEWQIQAIHWSSRQGK